MDLLGGYGSSDDDDDDSSVEQGPQVGTQAAPPAAASFASAAPSVRPSGASGIGTGAGGSGISRRGRRLLSLNAVLPPEIFDRLTRSGAAGAGGAGDDSSDEDEVDGGTNRNNHGSSAVPRSKGSSAAAGGGDASGEMGDFLRELRSASSVGPSAGGGKKKGKATGTGAKGETHNKNEEKLGLAFTQVSTTVTSKKDLGVADVHAETNHRVAKAASAAAVEAAPAPPAHAAASVASPRKGAPVPLPRPVVAALPRPGLSAAPLVRGGVSAPSYQQVQRQQQQQHQQYQQQAQYPHQEQQYQQQQSQQPAMGAQQSKKKSRRDLANALRAGNFDALGDDFRTSTLYQDDVDNGGRNYAPTEADLSEAAARTAAAAAAKRGAAGLRMYDPSAGGEVELAGGEVSQKHRSKHQINQLVAKAAVLEAHRAGGVGNGRTVKGSNTRADAKRKYGW